MSRPVQIIMKETILIFGAHGDDEIIGMGSTIAKYAKEGKSIVTIIFSYGEMSSPWLRKDLLIKDRVKETKEIGKFIGSSETRFLGLRDRNLEGDIVKYNIKNKVINLIKKYKPTKIFTHSNKDAHGDHRAVSNLVRDCLDEIGKDISLLVFEVWNVVDETHPKIYEDVSLTFRRKLEAMKRFKSQRAWVFLLWIPVWLRAKMIGILNGYKYGERFYKIR